MNVRDYLKMSLSSLLSNKIRSSLTMLGITIGNASVIGMVAIGQGAQKMAAEQFESLGPNVIFVSLNYRQVRRNLSPKTKPLLLDDAKAIAKLIPRVTQVSPEIHLRNLIAYRNNIFNNAIIGSTPEYLAVRNYQLDQGRFINNIDLRKGNRVAVLGTEVAQRLFSQQDPVGQQIRIKNLNFEIIGVLAAKGSLFDSNQDNTVIIPLTTAEHQLRGNTSPHGIPLTLIALLAQNQDSVSVAQFQIKNLISLRHPFATKDDINVYSQNVVLETASKTNAGLTRMLAAIASISLLVGGIGVMNIMLVSVAERTQEIGLRKALGAKEKDILAQFLIEAIMLATLGGVSGVGLGIGGTVVASAVSSLTTSISPVSIIVAITVSGGIGLLFGVFPAKQAAQLDPIVALRSS
ncbi:MAG TPA: ABC transporter permease [Cyanothece sp. UBA12306]|nr:ABC transporter permease [Cyanothece sp. UBA12306]